MKAFGTILLIGLLALPVAGMITILMWRFWGWFEATTGIESLGHSGPADWCFAVTYAFVLAVSLGGWLVIRKKRSNRR